MNQAHTEPERGHYPWEQLPTEDQETEDVIQTNAEGMVYQAVHDLAWKRQGIARILRDIDQGEIVRFNVGNLYDRILTITGGLALQVAPVLERNREVLARGPHAWRELREVYAEVLQVAQERERYWRYDVWEEPEQPEASDAVAS